MNIFFRTDSSISIGTGHVMRCVTLADELTRRGSTVSFMCREGEGSLINLIEEKGYKVHRLLHDASLEEDRQVAQKILLAERNKPDWLITDNYNIDISWETSLREYAKKIMVIDDLADKKHDCDILLNQNINATERDYEALVPDNCTKFIGPKYALLRNQFSSKRKTLRRRNGEIKKILVFLGGADPDNVTCTVLRALELLNMPEIEKEIVIGESNPNRDSVKEFVSQLPNANLHINVENMDQFMSDADLSIGSCGTATWERCCLGLPSIVIGLAENQLKIANKMQEDGAIIYTGWFEDVTAKDILEDISFLLRHKEIVRSISLKSLDCVDGKGTVRVTDNLLNIFSSIRLRDATPDDCWSIYEWRNDSEVRRYFFDSSPVSRDKHKEWFMAAISSSKTALLIGENGDKPVGVLRYDFDSEKALASIYMVPEFISRGVGVSVLKKGSGWIKRYHPEVRRIIAETKHGNIASQKIFERAGFNESHTTHSLAV